MKEKKAVIERTVDRKEFFDTFLRLLGANYPVDKRLANVEREVLVDFMLLGEPKFKYNRFSTLARKIVREKRDISRTYLNNYIAFIRQKKYIVKDKDGIECLNPFLEKILEVDSLDLNFKFTIKNEEQV